MILQNYVPHRRYHGEEPADIATEAARAYWRTGLRRAGAQAPAWSTAVTIEDMKRLIADARRLMPDVGIQVPPNLADWWPGLVAAGATDLGGLCANGDHIRPSIRFRRRTRCASSCSRRRRAHGAAVRLPAVHRPGVGRPGRARRDQAEVLELHPAPRVWPSGRAVRDPAGPGRGGARARRDGGWLTQEELTALFAETRPEVIEDMRRAADELRAELAGTPSPSS